MTTSTLKVAQSADAVTVPSDAERAADVALILDLSSVQVADKPNAFKVRRDGVDLLAVDAVDGSVKVSGASIATTDPEIGALAGLTSAADKGIMFTGAGTAGTYDLTAAARTVLDDATVGAMVDTLGGASSTGTGGLARATSPTFVTPVLGTPTSGTLTNCTGLPAASVLAPAIRVLTETHTAASFTDGGATTGTKSFTGTLPIGAITLGTKVIVNAGFAGDTTAVMTIGDGSDVDRYNTGLIDVFTTAANGVQSGVPSGSLLHTAVATPVLTVTTGADFTNALAGGGSVTVSIYYIATV